MGRLIDADDYLAKERPRGVADDIWEESHVYKSITNAPTVEAYTKDEIQKAIDEVEKYICDVETDTVKAQGMAQALDMFEQALKGGKDEP